MAAANLHDIASDELNYEIWAPIVKDTLTEKGLWDVVENGIPPDPSKIPELAATLQAEELSRWRDLAVKDMKALQILQSSLTHFAFKMTLSAPSAKEVWDSLEEGNKQAKRRELDEQFVAEYEMLAFNVAPVTFDEDMWMIYTTTSNHMTPYLKYFTALDRTHKARVVLANGSIIMAEGLGDVRFMTKEGKKTIKNVLFVPELDRNVFSVGQLTKIGYKVAIISDKCTIKDQNGRLFGKTMREERGFFLRLQVVGAPKYQLLAFSVGHVTFDKDMWMVHTTTSNHMTPYVKYFTTLDRTHRGRIKLIIRNTDIMSEGMGDVVIMTDEGKKTIKSVLFVPQLNRNILSVGQLGLIGYRVTIGSDKCIIKDQNRKIFGETMLEERGYAMRFQVIQGDLTP